jgi:hypothetical protein
MKNLGKGLLLGIGGAIGACMCLAVAVFAFVGMGASSAANSSTMTNTNETASQVGRIGDRIVSGGIALTILQVERTDRIGEFQEVEEGNQYLTAEVLIENIDRDEAPYNPLYFSVKDADGIEYTSDIYTAEGALQAGEIFKGDKVRGFVAFKMKENATELTLSYEPLVLLGGYETIRVLLEE